MPAKSDLEYALEREADRLKPAGRRKPSPAEPWRFVCPECERQVFGRDHYPGYACHNCDRRYARRELLDRAATTHD